MDIVKMISNDLRSSCRALLLGAHQGGAQKPDSIFHDILDNSEEIGTVSAGGNYKMTINFLFTDRMDMYNAQTYSFADRAILGTNIGYDQTLIWNNPRGVFFAVFWRGTTPLYANYIYSKVFHIGYRSERIHDISEDYSQSRPYFYLSDIEEYRKGNVFFSENLPVPSDLWQIAGTFNLEVNLKTGVTIRYTQKTYYPQSWPNENLEPPIIGLDSEIEKTEEITFGSFKTCPTYGGTFSDLTSTGVLDAWDEIANSICSTYGSEACFKHEKPRIISPTL